MMDRAMVLLCDKDATKRGSLCLLSGGNYVILALFKMVIKKRSNDNTKKSLIIPNYQKLNYYS